MSAPGDSERQNAVASLLSFLRRVPAILDRLKHVLHRWIVSSRGASQKVIHLATAAAMDLDFLVVTNPRHAAMSCSPGQLAPSSRSSRPSERIGRRNYQVDGLSSPSTNTLSVGPGANSKGPDRLGEVR